MMMVTMMLMIVTFGGDANHDVGYDVNDDADNHVDDDVGYDVIDDADNHVDDDVGNGVGGLSSMT